MSNESNNHSTNQSLSKDLLNGSEMNGGALNQDDIITSVKPVDLKTEGDGLANTVSDDEFGQVLNFDGGNSSSNVGYGDLSDVTTGPNFSFAAWVNFNSVNAWERIFDFGNGPGADSIILTRNSSSNNLGFHILSGNKTAIHVNASNAIELNQWMHVTATLSEDNGVTTAKLYIDGVLAGEGATTNSISTSVRESNWIGRSHWSQDDAFDGQIAHIQIADQALTNAEINQIIADTENGNNANSISVQISTTPSPVASPVGIDLLTEGDGLANTVSDDEFGQVLNFDGGNSSSNVGYGDLGDVTTGPNFSFAAWVNFNSVNAWERIFDFGNGPGADSIILTRNSSSNNLGFHILSGNKTAIHVNASNAIELNQWMHVTATLSEDNGVTTAKLYIDGVLAGEGATTNSISTSVRESNWIGRSHWSQDDAFDGQIAHIQIADQALTNAEINQIIADTENGNNANSISVQISTTPSPVASPVGIDLLTEGDGLANTVSDDEFGQVLNFDGGNSSSNVGYGDLGDVTTGPNFSFAAWVNFNSVNAWERIFDFGNGPGADSIILTRNSSSNNLGFHILSGNKTAIHVNASNAIELNQWMHVTATLSEDNGVTTAKLYIDGVLAGEGATTNSISTSVRESNWIGRSHWSQDDAFDGQIAHIQIADQALTNAEINQIIADTENGNNANSISVQISTTPSPVASPVGIDLLTEGDGLANTVSDDEFGQVLNFDGGNSSSNVGYGDLGDVTTGPNFSFAAWVNFNSVNAWERIFDFGNGPGADSIILTRNSSSNNLGFHILSGNKTAIHVNASNAIELNQWMHVTATLSEDNGVTTAKLYIDGVLAGEGATTNSISTSVRESNWIGRSHWSQDDAFDGQIAHIQIADQALTNAEINQIIADTENGNNANSISVQISTTPSPVASPVGIDLLTEGDGLANTVSDDEFGQVLNFDGGNSSSNVGYGDLGDVTTGPNFSFAAWVNFNSVNAWERIFDFGNGPGADSIILTRNSSSNNLGFHILSGNKTAIHVNASNAIELNQWMHVTATLSEDNGVTTAKLYIDGVLAGEGATTNSISTSVRESNWIGRSHWSQDDAFDGQIAHIQIADQALTNAEINQIIADTENGNNANSISVQISTTPSPVASPVGIDLLTEGDGLANTVSDDEFGQVLNFDGGNSSSNVGYGDLGDVTTGPNFSFAAWVNFNSVNAWERIFDFGNGPGADSIILTRNSSSNNLGFHILSGNKTAIHVNASNAIELNQWMHVTATLSEDNGVTTAKLYIDGVLAGEGATTNSISTSVRESNWIGRSHWSQDDAFDGQIAHIQIADQALTNAEINQIIADTENGNNANSISVQISTTPVAVDDSFSVDEDTALTIQVSDLLANDTDADGDTLTASNFVLADSTQGTLIDNGDGTLIFTPTADLNGDVNFTYTVSDGDGASDTGNTTITVNAVNDAPVINVGSASNNPASESIDLADLSQGQGFSIDWDGLGYTNRHVYYDVNGADFNNDGYDDILLGHTSSGVRIVYGKDTFGTSINVTSVDDDADFAIHDSRYSFANISNIGDINNDGVEDISFGAYRYNTAWVLYGDQNKLTGDFDLNSIDGTNGFVVTGAGGQFGNVGHVGDVNGDSIDDYLVNANTTSPGGTDYIAYGGQDFGSNYNMHNLSSDKGTSFNGGISSDKIQAFRQTPGDINGDGINDLITRSNEAPSGNAGGIHITYGGSTLDDVSSTSDLNGTNGISISRPGTDGSLRSGRLIGDVNGDGFDDLAIEHIDFDEGGLVNAGQLYVVYGSDDLSNNIDLSQLDGNDGFRVPGLYSNAGIISGSAAGDFNGDGLDDFIVGFQNADPNGRANAGEAYVILGRREGFDDTLQLDGSDESGIIHISGDRAGAQLGWSTSSLGDVNNDGYDDISIAPQAGTTGEAHVIFGFGNSHNTGDNGTVVISDLSVSDVDAGTDDLTFTLSAGNGTLTVDAAFSSLVTANGSGTITLIGTLVEINALLSSANGITYLSDANFSGSDTVTLTLNDQGNNGSGGALTDIQTIQITVPTVRNTAPVAVDDSFSVDEDTALTIQVSDLLANDTDADGDTLTASNFVLADSTQGTLIDNGDGTLIFTPTADLNGDVNFTYTVSDGDGASDTGNATITVNEAQTTYTAGDVITLRSNSSGDVMWPNITPLDTGGFRAIWQELNGSQHTQANQFDLFAQEFDANGVAVGDLDISSTHGVHSSSNVRDNDVSASIVSIDNGHVAMYNYYDISPVDAIPRLHVYDNNFQKQSGINLTRDNNDGGLHTLGGLVKLSGNSVAVSWIGYNGIVLRKVDIADDYSSTYTQTLIDANVNATDVRSNSLFTTTDGDYGIVYMHNESDDYSVRLQIFNADGTLQTATPVTVHDNVGTDAALQISTIKSTELSDGRILITYEDEKNGQIDIYGRTYDRSTGTLSGESNLVTSSLNDVGMSITSLADGGFYMFWEEATSRGIDGITAVIKGQRYDVSLNKNGNEITLFDGVDGFSPIAQGRDGFVRVDDIDAFSRVEAVELANGDIVVSWSGAKTAGDESSAFATILKASQPNTVPIAVDDSFSVDEDTALTIQVSDLLANDTDADGDTLTASNFVLADSTQGTLIDNGDGTLTFTPTADFNGDVNFTYTVSDGDGASDTGNATITVNAVNDAPVVVDDSFSVDEDTALTIQVSDLLANDTDADGDTLTASNFVLADSTQGTLIDNGDGTLTFTPTADFNGDVNFTYTVSDGDGASDTGNATITVNAINDAPVAVDDSFSVDEDTALTIQVSDLLANDTDADGDTLTASNFVLADTSQGTLIDNGDGTLIFTPTADLNGDVNFTYTVSDGDGASDTGNATITVNEVNDAPVINVSSINQVSSGTNRSDDIFSIPNSINETIAVLTDGNYVVTWPNASADGNDTGVYARIYDANNNPRSPEIKINTTFTNTPESPVIGALSGGGFVAVWVSDDTGQENILFSQRFDADGNKIGDERSAVGGGFFGTIAPTIGTFTDDTYVVAWGVNSFNHFGFVQHFSADGDEITDRLRIPEFRSFGEPHISVQSDNSYILSHNDGAGGNANFGQRFNADGTFDGSSFGISEGGRTSGTSISLFDDGGFIATDSVSAQQIFVARVFDKDNQLIITHTYEAAEFGSLTAASVDVLPNNNYVVFIDSAAGLTGVIYDQNHVQIGNNFTVGNVSATNPSVDVLDNDNYIISWYEEDGGIVLTQKFTLSGISEYNTGDNGTTVISDLSVSDVDAGTDDLTFTLSAGNGTLTVDAAFSSLVTANGSGTITLIGTLVEINALLSSANGITYLSDANFSGSDTVTLTLNDQGNNGSGGALTDIQTIQITVPTARNTAPVAVDDSFSVDEDTALTIQVSDLLANDTDADGDTLTASNFVLADSTQGTLIDNGDGTLTFTPTADFNGDVNFTYTVSDGDGASDTGNATITVNEVNDAPVINVSSINQVSSGTNRSDDIFSIPNSINETIAVLTDGNYVVTWPNASADGNDTGVYARIYDANNNPRSPEIKINTTFTNTPESPVIGALSGGGFVAVWVSDDTGQENILFSQRFDADGNKIGDERSAVGGGFFGTIAPTIGTFTDDTYVVAWGVNSFNHFGFVQHFSADGDEITDRLRIPEFRSFGEPHISVQSDNSYILSHNDGAGGNANFGQRFNADGTFDGSSFGISEGGRTSGTSISLFDDGGFIATDSVSAQQIFVARVFDKDNQLIITHTYEAAEFGSLTAASVDVLPNNNYVVFIDSAAGLTGVIYDQNHVQIGNNFTVGNVSATNPSVDVLDNDNYIISWYEEDGGIVLTQKFTLSGISEYNTGDNGTIVISDLSVSDVDAGTDDLTFTLSAGNGTLTVDATFSSLITVNAGQTITLTGSLVEINALLSSANGITYLSDANFSGSDTVTLTLNDQGNNGSGGALTDIQTIQITVPTARNTAPVAVDDSFSVDEDTALTIQVSDLLANDTDADGDTLTASNFVLADSTQGTLIDNGDGTLTFTPTADFNGDVNFTYTVSDGDGASDTGNATITVNAVNDAPVVVDDSFSVDEDTALTIQVSDLLANDTDADGDTLTASNFVLADSTQGTLIDNGDGTLTFTPTADFNGDVNFTYTVSDGDGASDTGNATITVNAINDAPVAVDDSFSVDEDTALTIQVSDLLANDTDADGDTLTASNFVLADTSQGTLIDNGDGTLIFTPTADLNGDVNFTYTVSDGDGASDTGNATITVNEVNDAPVINVSSINQVSSGTNRSDDIFSIPNSINETIAVLTDGNYVVTWPNASADGNDTGVYARIYDANNNPRSPEIKINTTFTNTPESPVIGALSGGGFVAVWVSDDTGQENILFSQRFDADGNKIGDERSAVGGGFFGTIAPTIGTFTDDTYVVAWGVNSFNHFGFVQHFSADGDEITDRLRIPEFRSFGEPHISVQSDNSYILSHNDGAGGNANFGQRFNADGTFDGSSFGISEGGRTSGTSISLFDDGGFIATDSVSAQQIFVARVFDKDNQLIITHTYEAAEFGSLTAASVDVLPNNNYVVFIDSAAGLTGVIYDQNHVQIGNNFTVGNVSATNPSVDVLDNDNYIISWYEEDGGIVLTQKFTLSGISEYNTGDNGTTVISDLSVSDVDAGTDDLTFTLSAGNGTLTVDAAFSSLVTANGSGTITLIGTLVEINALLSSANGITYLSDANFSGSDTVTLTLNDQGNNGSGGALTDIQTIQITVPTARNTAPVAVDDSFSVDEDTALTIQVSDLLANDTDADGDTLTASNFVLADSTQGTLIDNGDGTLTFTPTADFNGDVNFTYTVSDGDGASDTGNATITVNEVNDAPVINVSSINQVSSGTNRSDDIFSIPNSINETIAVLTDGNYVVTWPNASADGNDTGVYARIYDANNNPRSPEIKINTTFTNTPESPVIGALSGGGFVAVWVSDDTGQENILFSQRFDADGNKIGDERSAVGGGFFGTIAPTIGTFTDDTYVVAWGVNSFNHFGFVQHFSADGDEITDRLRIPEFRSFGEPHISVQSDNSYILSHNDGAGGNANFGQRFNADGTFDGSSFGISEGGRTSGTSISLFDDGGFIATDSVSAQQIFVARVFDKDNQLIITHTYEAAEFGSLTAASVDVLPNNNYVVFIDSAAGLTGVIYDQNHVQIGNNFTVGNVSATNPSVDVLDNDNYIISWYEEDGGIVLTQKFTLSGISEYNTGDNGTIVISDLSVSDVDAGTDDLTFTLSAGNGTLTVDAAFSSLVTANGSGTITLIGTLVEINALLSSANGITYLSDANFSGSDTVTLTLNDQGNNGSGGALTDIQTIQITVPTARNIAPIAVDDSFSVDEDTALTIQVSDLLANDTDADGDTLTASNFVLADTSQGTLLDNGDGTLTFTPTADFNGDVNFTYTVSDGDGASDTGNTTITVNAVNDAPVVVDDSFSVDEDTALTIQVSDLLANDTDADGDTLTASNFVLADSTQGTLIDNGDGTLTFTPTADFNGDVNFTYTVSDGDGASDTGNATITVNAINDAPVVVDDSFSVDEDTALTIQVSDLLANDTDADGDTLTASNFVLADTSQGTLLDNGDGTLTFTPTADFNGDVNFTYTVSDGDGASDTGNATITVNEVNDAPVINVSSINQVSSGTNRSDDIFSIPNSINETIAVLTDGNYVVTWPNASADGNDTGVYARIYDANNNPRSPEIKINTTFTNTPESPVIGALSGGGFVAVWVSDDTGQENILFSQRFDADGNKIGDERSAVGGGFFGTIAPTIGTFTDDTYVVAWGVNSFNHFGFVQHFSADGDEITDRLRIPEFRSFGEPHISVQSDNSYILSHNDGAGGNANFGQRFNADGTFDGSSFGISEGGRTSGTSISLFDDGGFIATDSVSAQQIFVARVFDKDNQLIITHTYEAAEFGSLTAASVDVLPNNNYVVFIDSAAGLTGVIYDQNHVQIGNNFTVGNVSATNPSVDVLDNDNYIISWYEEDGGIVLTQKFTLSGISEYNTGDNGTTVISDLSVSDVDAGTDDLTFTLSAGNGTLTVDAAFSSLVTANGSGTITLIGTLVEINALLSSANGITYLSDANFSGSDTVTLTLNDQGNNGSGGALTDIQTIQITVPTARNTAPVAVDDSFSVDEDTALTIQVSDLLANDTDADGDTLTASNFVLADTSQGTLIDNGDGTLIFTPTADFNGDVNFTYTVSDGDGASDTGNATITVNEVNDAPVVVDDSFSVDEDTALTIQVSDLLANDTDADGDTLTASNFVLADSTQGTLIDNGDGTLTFTPTADFNGDVNFTYTVSDGDGASDTGNATITVNAINDAPVAVDDSFSVDEDTALTIQVSDLLANDTDADGDTLTASNFVLADSTQGTLIDNGDGTLIFTPTADLNGDVNFTYTVSDGDGASDTGNATITVNEAQTTYTAGDVITLRSNSSGDVMWPNITPLDTGGFRAIWQELNGSQHTQANQFDLFAQEFDANGVAVGDLDISSTHGVHSSSNVRDNDVSASIVSIDNGHVAMYNYYDISPVDAIPRLHVYDNNFQKQSGINLTRDNNDGGLHTLGGLVKLSGNSVAVSWIGYNGIVLRKVDIADDYSSTYTQTLIDANVNATDVRSNSLFTTTDGDYGIVYMHNESDDYSVRLQIFNADGTLQTATPVTVHDNVGTDAALQISTIKSTELSDGRILITYEDEKNGQIDIYGRTYDRSTGTLSGESNLVTSSLNDVGMSITSLADGGFYMFWEEATSRGIDGITAVIKGQRYDVSLNKNGNEITLFDGVDGFSPIAQGRDGFVRVDDIDAFSRVEAVELANGDIVVSWSGAKTAGDESSAFATILKASQPNTVPIAVDDSFSVDEDTALTIQVSDLLANDTDADGDTLTASNFVLADSTQGTLIDNGDGTLTFTPTADFNGDVNFTYTVSDGDGASDTGNATITVNAVNDAPVVVDDSFSVDEDTALTIQVSDLLANDTDADGDTLTASNFVLADSTQGTLIDNGDGTLTFTPTADFNGDVNFTYTVSDGDGASDTGNATITVNAINDAPVISSTSGNKIIATDPEGDAITYSLVSAASIGSVTIDAVTGDYSYIRDGRSAYSTQYTVAATDSHGAADTETITENITFYNRAPIITGYYIRHYSQGENDYTETIVQAYDPDGDNIVSTSATTSTQNLGAHNYREVLSLSATDVYGATSSRTYSREYSDPNGRGNDDPVIFDLDGDGLSFTPWWENTVAFDSDLDGLLERTSWIDSDDAFLAYDYDGDSLIKNTDEINFTYYHPDAKTDLEGLALAFDDNFDGVFDAQDSKWADFGLWQDKDSDGVTDEGEFMSLDHYDITSINLESDGVIEEGDGYIIHGMTQFTRVDGTVGEAGDVSLVYNDDKLSGGDGNDKLYGGYGDDHFIFNAGDDQDIIYDFEDGKDRIDLSGYKKTDGTDLTFQDLSIAEDANGGDTIITGFNAGDQITVEDIFAKNITENDFLF